jgi:hypothetical protein
MLDEATKTGYARAFSSGACRCAPSRWPRHNGDVRERVEVKPTTIIGLTLRYTCPVCNATNDLDWATLYRVSRWEARCERCAQPVAFIVPASDSLGRHLPHLQAKLHDERA